MTKQTKKNGSGPAAKEPAKANENNHSQAEEILENLMRLHDLEKNLLLKLQKGLKQPGSKIKDKNSKGKTKVPRTKI
jgi:hypothetical protein